jgi:hypothetical protein
MQRFYHQESSISLGISPPSKTSLFISRKLGGDSPSISLLYKVIHHLFKKNSIYPANQILTGGPHCLRHLTWGTAMKPFYRDSLIELRRVVYRVFNQVLRSSNGYPMISAPELRLENHQAANAKNHPRVIIVTRNTTRADPSPFRKLSRQSELDLQAAFRMKGSAAVICCNFQHISTTTKLLSYFGHTNICIGIHGKLYFINRS